MRQIKRYLEGVRRETKELFILREKSEWLRASLIPGAQRLKDVIVQTSAPEDKVADTVAEIVMLDQKIQKQIEKIAKKQAAAIDIIGRVTDSRQRQVLTLYYLPNDKILSIDEVAEEIGYSPIRARQIRDRGLDEAERLTEL